MSHILVAEIAPLQGPAGPPGPSGASGVQQLQLIAATALSGHRVVAASTIGQAEYAEPVNAAHADCVLGITIGASSAGALSTIQWKGEITEPSFAFTPQQLIFCGVGGALTQSPPTVGFLLAIGYAVTSTRIMLDIKQAILR